MKEHEIKVVMCQPGKKAFITNINTSLESLQSTVGGLIEPYYLDENIVLWCNDEGKIRNLPLNRAILDEEGKIIEVIAGTFFIAKDDGSEDEDSDGFTDLSDDEANQYLERYLYPDDIFFVGNEIIAIPYYGAEEGGQI